MGELSVSNIHFPSHPSLRMYGIKCMRPLLVTLVEMARPFYKRLLPWDLSEGWFTLWMGLGTFPSPQGQQDKKYTSFYYQLCDNKIASSRRLARSSTHLMFRDRLELNHLYKTTEKSSRGPSHCGYARLWKYLCLLLRIRMLLFTVWTYFKEQNLRMHFLLESYLGFI